MNTNNKKSARLRSYLISFAAVLVVLIVSRLGQYLWHFRGNTVITEVDESEVLEQMLPALNKGVELQPAVAMEIEESESILSPEEVEEILSKVEAGEMAGLMDFMFSSPVFDTALALANSLFQPPMRPLAERVERNAQSMMQSHWSPALRAADLSAEEFTMAYELILAMLRKNAEANLMFVEGELTSKQSLELTYTHIDIKERLAAQLGEELANNVATGASISIQNAVESRGPTEFEKDQKLYPAYSALKRESYVELEAYLAAGTDVNERRTYQPDVSLLDLAVQRESASAVEVLLRHGADMTIADEHGYTPLHRAAMHGEPKVVKLLLDAGADPTARTNIGLTPKMVARLNALSSPDDIVGKIIMLLED